MKEKQVEEMAEAIFHNCNCGLFFSEAEKIARFVIEEQGYRKQSEVAREISEAVKHIAEGVKFKNDVEKTAFVEMLDDLTRVKMKAGE